MNNQIKHLTLYNRKLNFPCFDMPLSTCFDFCEYGKESNLCYAGNNPAYKIYNLKKLQSNEDLLNSKNFVNVIKKEILLSNSRKIRFFSSGDMTKLSHLEKIIKLANELKPYKIQIWLSTHNDSLLFKYYENRKNDLENLNIVLSNKIPNSNMPEFLINWLFDKNLSYSETTNEKSLSNCHASINSTSCDLCENCFKQKSKITYFLHGKFAEKRLKKYQDKKSDEQ